MNKCLLTTVSALACTLAAMPAVSVAAFPTKPIRVVVPFPPGGTSDILTRIIGEKLASALGYQIVVDNRPGAGGVIATDIVAKANPDGHTLYMTFVSHAINPYVYAKLPYDTEKDFAPIGLFAVTPNIVVVT
ncbi:MAG: tripartite tricarboxylate transporter substrate binding protein, partial [Burkholderiales bacterium]|nr:tripartite tricarboxylate transporter substrate binding protein [Burkholderiales bacterium]